MNNKINLETERMFGYGSYQIDSYQVNYLYGLNDLCEKFVTNEFEILELGSNDGVSTSLFANFGKKVTSVDLVKTEKMNNLLKKNKNIYFYNMSFKEFLNIDKDNKYDLIYIDGDHSYKSVYEDIENFKHKVKLNGFISGHDFNKSAPGVEQAVRQHFPKNEIFIFSDSSWLIKI